MINSFKKFKVYGGIIQTVIGLISVKCENILLSQLLRDIYNKLRVKCLPVNKRDINPKNILPS